MQKHAIISLATLAIGALAIASCADGYEQRARTDNTETETETETEGAAVAAAAATVKPGANVIFSHEFLRNTIVGGPQIVRLTIDESYDSGQLEVEIVDSDGVTISQTRKTVINLAAADRHTWDVQFETPQEGRFYIGILATIRDSNGTTAHRAYSIPVYVGDVTGYKPEVEGYTVDQTPEGQSIVTMEAQETIE